LGVMGFGVVGLGFGSYGACCEYLFAFKIKVFGIRCLR
jgi:hypothetical protein